MRRLVLVTLLAACGEAPAEQDARSVLRSAPPRYEAVLADADARAPRAPVRTTVLTFNLRWADPNATGAASWSHRRAGAIAIVEASGADLVGTQEAMAQQADDLEAALPAYTRVSVANQRVPEQHDSMLLFAKDRYALLEAHHFWLSRTPDVPYSDDFERDTPGHGPRTITCALLAERSGAEVVFCNTHFDGDRRVNEASARLLTQRLDERYPGRPTIVTGDFNALPYTDTTWDEAPAWAAAFESTTYAHLVRRFVDAQAALQPEHPAWLMCPKGECTRGDLVRIDWVLASRGFEPVESRTMSRFHDAIAVTDHWPIAVTLASKRHLARPL